MSSSTQALIQLRNVGLFYGRDPHFYGKARGRFWAIQNVSLDLYPGETLGIVGRNGAGKSTLLRVIAGILQPDKGQMAQTDCQISLLTLQVGFVPYLTGRENAILSGMLLGFTRAQVRARMAEIIAFAELEDFIDQPIYSYSTGMKARLGFSVAFYTNPEILLVDETLGVGDAAFRKKSTDKMKERIRSNKTVVLVSHNARIIEELCDRTVWLEQGQTKMEGPTAEVMAAYKDFLARPPETH